MAEYLPRHEKRALAFTSSEDATRIVNLRKRLVNSTAVTIAVRATDGASILVPHDEI